MVLWLLLLAQALTGTVNSDDVLYTGQFYYVFDSGVSDFLASYHETIFNVLLGFIALHVVSVIWVSAGRVITPTGFASAARTRSACY